MSYEAESEYAHEMFDQFINDLISKGELTMPKVTPIKFVPPGECRLSYVNIFEPAPPMNPGQEPVRQVSLLFPKTDQKTINVLVQNLNKIVAAGISAKFFTSPQGLHNPLRDGDAEVASGNRGKEYAGMIFMSAKSWRPVGVVNRQNQPILDPDELYSGCWANVQISFKAFSRSGNKGIRVEINLIQKTRDDDRFDGADNPEDVFTVLEPAAEESPAQVFGGMDVPGIPEVPDAPQTGAMSAPTTEPEKPADEKPAVSNPFADFV